MYTAYPARFSPDDNETYLISFPDVPQAHTFWKDKETANPIAADALAAALSFYVEDGKPLPVPSPPNADRS